MGDGATAEDGGAGTCVGDGASTSVVGGAAGASTSLIGGAAGATAEGGAGTSGGDGAAAEGAAGTSAGDGVTSTGDGATEGDCCESKAGMSVRGLLHALQRSPSCLTSWGW